MEAINSMEAYRPIKHKEFCIIYEISTEMLSMYDNAT